MPYLLLGEDEAAITPWLIAWRSIILLIRRDKDIHGISLPSSDYDVRAFERTLILLQRLHFEAGQLDAGLELLHDLIVEMGFFVIDEDGHD